MQIRAKDWCFTINNPRSKDWKKIWRMPYKYLCFQVELGESGTPHFQGFIQFEEKLRLSALKKLHKSAHWEKRRGTPYEAAHYCQKPVAGCDCQHCHDLVRFDHVHEAGYMTADNAARMHEVARCIIDTGLHRAVERFPELYLQFPRGFESLALKTCPQRDFETEVTVLYGIPGSGKTRYAMSGDLPTYKLACFGQGTDFFGEYDPLFHQVVVVDDFYGNWKYTTFLQVADRYPTEVHCKGGFLQFLAKQLVITSNLAPDQWYRKVLLEPVRRESFFRRIHNIIEVTTVGYLIHKGHLPWDPPTWFHQANVNEFLGSAAPPILDPEFIVRRREWYAHARSGH